MMNLAQIKQSLEQVRKHKQTAAAAASAMNADVSKIDQRFSPEVRAAETAKIRAKHLPTITTALSEISKINNQVRPSIGLWENKEFILSTRPITKCLGGDPFHGPEDPAAEAMTRLARMNELAKMPSTLLEAHAAAAKATNKHGELFLCHLENGSRDAKAPGWKAIDLTDVILPDQNQALSLLNESKAVLLETEHIFRGADGGRAVTPQEKINLARLQNEVTHVG